MSFGQTLWVLVRQWAWSIPALVLTLFVGTAAALATPGTYRAEVQVLLLPAALSPETSEPTNPFLGFGGAIGSTGEILARVVTSPSVAEKVAASGAQAPYEVIADPSTAAPVLLVSAEADNAAAVTLTTDAVVAAIHDTLEAQQEAVGAPQSTWITSRVLIAQPVQRQFTGQIRVGVVAAGGVALLSLALLFWREARRSGRRRRVVPTVLAPPVFSAEPAPHQLRRRRNQSEYDPRPVVVSRSMRVPADEPLDPVVPPDDRTRQPERRGVIDAPSRTGPVAGQYASNGTANGQGLHSPPGAGPGVTPTDRGRPHHDSTQLWPAGSVDGPRQ